jgi:hypothetical protein
VSRTLAFQSYLLLLDVFEVDALEILWQLILYVMIDKLETSNTHEINNTEQQTGEFQQYDAMARYVFISMSLLVQKSLKRSYD